MGLEFAPLGYAHWFVGRAQTYRIARVWGGVCRIRLTEANTFKNSRHEPLMQGATLNLRRTIKEMNPFRSQLEKTPCIQVQHLAKMRAGALPVLNKYRTIIIHTPLFPVNSAVE